MTTPYAGIAANVNLNAGAATLIPVDGDSDNAATLDASLQTLTDYIEALRAATALAVLAFAEGFEGATFPPTAAAGTPGWSTPSTRFAADLAWARSTVNPIAGVASATAPVPQAVSTNSSLGLLIGFASPSRISFLFAVDCNANTSDHLDFYVDGVLTASLSSQTSNVLVGGKFISDVLREGPHTFDWRFVRGATASVGAEECKLDTVEIIPESFLASDPTRMHVFDDAWGGPFPLSITLVSAGNLAGSDGVGTPTEYRVGANAGTYIAETTPDAHGIIGMTTGASAIGDYVAAAFGSCPTAVTLAQLLPFVEVRPAVPVLSANAVAEAGLFDQGAPTAGNFVGWAWDGSLGVGSTWRFRAIAAGAQTTVDSGIAVAANALIRLGVTIATVRGVTGAVFMKDGKALPGAGNVPPLMVAGLPVSTTNSMWPGVRIRSVTAATAVKVKYDWIRAIMGRP